MTTTTTAVETTDVSASVALEGRDSEGRQVWAYSIRYGSTESVSASDYRTGVNASESPETVLRSLAGFLAAHSESREGGENADLFPLTREASEAISEAIYNEIGWDE